VTEIDGITAVAIRAWREQFLAPGGTLVLALLRSGRDPTATSMGVLGQLQEKGMCIDVLLELCLDSSSAERPFHSPEVSEMNRENFARFQTLMPPPPPPVANFGSLFTWLRNADDLTLT